MGMITESVLNLCGFQVYRIDEEAEVEDTVDAACSMAFTGGNFQVAILLSQRMVDRNKKGH
jgi:sulfopyruvate decarboxylase TPP-binding subunit